MTQFSKEIDAILDEIKSVGKKIVEQDPKNFRIAYQENDSDSKKNENVGHFLKYKEKRIGSDFWRYAILAEHGDGDDGYRDFALQVIMPLGLFSKKAQNIGIDFLKSKIDACGDKKEAFESLIETFISPTQSINFN